MQVGEHVRTEFAKAMATSTATPDSISTSVAAAELKSEKYKEMLDDQVNVNKDISAQLEAMRLKVYDLTSQAAKFAAESEMKDHHIALLKVDITTHRAAARDDQLASAWGGRQMWAHGRKPDLGGAANSVRRGRS